MNVNLHLTDRTQLHADGYALEERLFAAVRWGPTDPDAASGQGLLWGTPANLRRLAAAATLAAIQAEEDACWRARQAASAAAAAAADRGRVA